MNTNFTNNKDVNISKTVSNVNVDDNRLVLYAIGELTADEMADIDEYAFTHPEANAKLEDLLEIVDLIETSPELEDGGQYRNALGVPGEFRQQALAVA